MDTLRTAGCRILGTEETFQKVNSHDMKKRTVWSTGGVGGTLRSANASSVGFSWRQVEGEGGGRAIFTAN